MTNMFNSTLLAMVVATAFAGCHKDHSWRFDRVALQGELRLVALSIKKEEHRAFDFSAPELVKLEKEMGAGFISFKDGAVDFDFISKGEFLFSDGYSFETNVYGIAQKNKFVITYLLPGERNAMSDISQHIDLSKVLSKARIQRLFGERGAAEGEGNSLRSR